MIDETRRLRWPDCENVRDLGGLPTTDGNRIRKGALVRADSLHRLTPAGVAALRRYGISRVIDLRSPAEAAVFPGPLAGDRLYRLSPLGDPDAEANRNPAVEPTVKSAYLRGIARNAPYIVAALTAIADAPPGGVLVHCVAGKDRTGILVALLLRVAGATDEAIAADYAYTSVCLRERFDAELSEVSDESVRHRLREWQSSVPEAILALLRHVDERYGSVNSYLLAHGLAEAQLTCLRQRLREPI